MLVLTVVSSIVGASVLKYATNEKKINRRHFLRLEAKNAAEAAVEYGSADLISRFETRKLLPTDELKTNSLTLPASISTLFDYGTSGSHCNVNPANMAVFGSMVNGSREYIDPTEPANEFDPMKGRTTDLYEVTVYGSATATDPLGPSITSYASQTIRIRDAPLFTHAIFYNILMEISPGPKMDVEGPVHSNMAMYIRAATGLSFHDVVTSAGSIHWGALPGTSDYDSTADVTFRDGADNPVSMHDGTDWIDSDMADWRAIASQRWDGYVQSSAHGVHKHNTVATGDYVPDDPNTPGNELQNPAHDLIEPPDFAAAGTVLENEKFANKAGLYLHVDTTAQNVTMFKNAAARNAYITSGDTSGIVTYVDDLARPLLTYAPGVGESSMTESDGSSDELTGGETLQVSSSMTYTSSMTNADGSSYDGTVIDHTFFDYRWGKTIDTYSIDVGVLREAINGTGSGFGNYNVASTSEASPGDWNGIVYVELSNPAESKGDSTRAPAVRLHNGKEIPNRREVNAGGADGFTLATNGALYVQGHFNADGQISASSATTPETGESPAALIADAINVLSAAWNDTHAALDMKKRKATKTEVSAAFLTGVVPSDPNRVGDVRYSGGVENFPRFMENWATTELAYRGSMVALFESEVAVEPWGKSNVYSPPKRMWGFNALFGQAIRRFPPGTPHIRSYRRVDYRELDQATYTAAQAVMTP